MLRKGLESGGDRHSARQIQTGHFPYMQGAKGTDSAVRDSNDNSSDAPALFLYKAIPSHQPLGGQEQPSQHNGDKNVTMWPVPLILNSSLWKKRHGFCLVETDFMLSLYFLSLKRVLVNVYVGIYKSIYTVY